MLSDSGLKEATIEKICTVFSRYPEIEEVILYGSRAMGRYRNGSDIDLTMVGEGVTHALQLKIENELDDLLLPYKIDLSVLTAIDNAGLLAHIDRVGKVFYHRT
ncbi:nucleotidyltransferase domain-containing protein [Geomonas paludis]|uniref:Nucleotidyltransferase domain-containing protein n=1 Tax=Geomonas paludis TaxID=2740185 RepID=A0ABY4LA14_9BACT|nr:nucleotidyltransferase domain-containing protein [Geomonas paludis]UPU34782.1 nucleotidyltransferase domain-containing protein [Geomonas paludis]